MFDRDTKQPSKQEEGLSGELGLIIQELVSSGHSWPNIKKYTLSEIGVFLRSIRIKKINEKIEKVSFDWMASNTDQEGIEKIIKSIKKESLSSKEESKKEIANDWRRLASLRIG